MSDNLPPLPEPLAAALCNPLHASFTADQMRAYAAAAVAAALEAQQEPVAWQDVHDHTNLYWRKPWQVDARPLYTAPPARKPLTDEQMLRLVLPITHDAPSTYEAFCYESGTYSVTKLRSSVIALIRAIERAHGIGGGE